jgi:hypothetical protein
MTGENFREVAMFDWLFEGRLTVYLILGGLAFLSLLLYSRERKQLWAWVGVAFLALVGLYFLLDRLVETGREQVARKLNEMAAAVKTRDTEALFRNISEKFHFGLLDRASFRQAVERALRDRWVDEILVWDIEDKAEWSSSSNSARVTFQSKPVGAVNPERMFFRVESDFVRDPDGQWRLAGFQVFNPAVNTNEPLDIPQLGP